MSSHVSDTVHDAKLQLTALIICGLKITWESTFATIRHRTKVTKGPGSKAVGLAMTFKLIEAAQHRWRAVNVPHLVALVRAGARFEHGKLLEREPSPVTQEAA